jgi:hypothetical protein
MVSNTNPIRPPLALCIRTYAVLTVFTQGTGESEISGEGQKCRIQITKLGRITNNKLNVRKK